MCLIIHKPRRIDVPEWLVESAIWNNSDGFGVMSRNGIDKKKFVTVSDAMACIESHDDSDAAIHFRFRTSGNVSLANVHPFRVRNMHLMHNGTMYEYTGRKQKSDTRAFCDEWLEPLIRAGHTPNKRTIEDEIGATNVLAIMFPDGNIKKYNAHLGMHMGNLWLSNSYAWDYPNSTKRGASFDWSVSYKSEDTPVNNQMLRWQIEDDLLELINLDNINHISYLEPYLGDAGDHAAYREFKAGKMELVDYLEGLSNSAIVEIVNMMEVFG